MKDLYLMFPQAGGTILPELYGHFTEHIGGVIYDGIWVGRDSEVENVHGFRREMIARLAELNPPVIRWPGGCFAETYDWRDGIGKKRPVRPNWWTRWDGRYESNQVGTHEFVDFCELLGAKPYFAANITSTTPQHIRDWMDYCTSPQGTTSLAAERAENGHPQPFVIPFWGIGNENWGGGGNMDPAMYAREYRKYSALADNLPGEKTLIACGPNAADYHWTRRFMETIADSEKHMQGFSLHYYCGSAGDPTSFSRDQWCQQLEQALRMEEILLRHHSIIRGYGLEKQIRLVIDEWGCWHPDGSGPSRGGNLFEQQSTMRDAMVSAVTLNIFNRHCEKLLMANVAQLVNNLHALFLAAGKHCIVTPTYHVFRMYREHQGAQMVPVAFQQEKVEFCNQAGKTDTLDALSVSASHRDGHVTLTLANLSPERPAELVLRPVGCGLSEEAQAIILSCEDCHGHNTFEEPCRVKPETVTVRTGEKLVVPPAGIVSFRAKLKSADL